jgi:hypothetical protein
MPVENVAVLDAITAKVASALAKIALKAVEMPMAIPNRDVTWTNLAIADAALVLPWTRIGSSRRPKRPDFRNGDRFAVNVSGPCEFEAVRHHFANEANECGIQAR